MANSESTDRKIWVDRAKGMGILLVVYGHVILGLYPTNLASENTFLYHTYLTIYSFHMPLFFFLSGLFVLRWTTRRILPASVQKADSLLRPYIVWSIAFSILLSIFGTYANNEHAINLSLIAIQPSAHLWFLYVLFFVFATYYLLAKLHNERIVMLLVSLLFFLSPYIHFWVLGQLFFYLFFFTCGAWYAKYSKRINTQFSLLYAMTFLSLFAAMCYLIQTNILPTIPITQLFCALFGILSCIELSKLSISWLVPLGSLSMAIYVAHPIFTAGVRTALHHTKFLQLDTFIVSLLCFTAGIVGSIGLLYVSKVCRIKKYIY